MNRARNLGYEQASGDFIQWMDADDELAPDKIALQVAALQADPVADIAYGDWVACRIGADGRTQMTPYVLAQVDDQITRTLTGVWYPPHLYLLRRASADRLQAAQAWWPSRPVATDVEYSAIAALLGLRFLHVPGAKVRYNIWSHGQISGGTPYDRRIASLAAIFRRLRAMARESGARLGAGHRLLLDQDWNIWRLSPSAVALTPPGRGKRLLRRRDDGRQIALHPREAAVAEALLRAPGGLATCHLALQLAEIVPDLAADHVAAVRILRRLQVEGFMDCLARTATDGD